MTYYTTVVCAPATLEEGYDILAHKAMERKWALFKLRPKLHMQAHLVSLRMQVVIRFNLLFES